MRESWWKHGYSDTSCYRLNLCISLKIIWLIPITIRCHEERPLVVAGYQERAIRDCTLILSLFFLFYFLSPQVPLPSLLLSLCLSSLLSPPYNEGGQFQKGGSLPDSRSVYHHCNLGFSYSNIIKNKCYH